MNDFKNENDINLYKRINSEGNEIESEIYIQCTKTNNITFKDWTFIKYLNLYNNDIYYKYELFEKPIEKDFTSVNK